MGWYFNKGRGNLPLTLSNQVSTSVRGNTWVELCGSDETTASVMRAVRRGQLHRQENPPAHLRPEPPKKEAGAKAGKLPAEVPLEEPRAAKPRGKAPKASKGRRSSRSDARTDAVKTPDGDEVTATAAAAPKPFTAVDN